jgi:hypothetical protein
MSAAPHLLQQHGGALARLQCRVLAKPFHLADLLALIKEALAPDQSGPAWA